MTPIDSSWHLCRLTRTSRQISGFLVVSSLGIHPFFVMAALVRGIFYFSSFLPIQIGPTPSVQPNNDEPLINGKTYDYVVVGGGLTGLVVANRLSEDKDRKCQPGENVCTLADRMKAPFWLSKMDTLSTISLHKYQPLQISSTPSSCTTWTPPPHPTLAARLFQCTSAI
jgi:hypothetical protein